MTLRRALLYASLSTLSGDGRSMTDPPAAVPAPCRCFWPLIQLGVYGFVPVRSLKIHCGFWGKYLIIQPLIQLLVQLSV